MLLRSVLFNLAFWGWTLFMVVVCIPALMGPQRWAKGPQRGWSRGAAALARVMMGIDYVERGKENLPDGPVIIAVKHQSTYETFMFNLLVPNPATVMKKELLMVPLFGWYAWRSGMIPIDRKGTAGAMRRMMRAADKAVAQGRQLVIFPEGTRTAAGKQGEYRPGVAGLYRHLKIPVVPVALNSGVYWPRRTIMKHPGTVIFEYLPPIEPGLDRKAFMNELITRIEAATNDLLDEVGFDPVDNSPQ